MKKLILKVVFLISSLFFVLFFKEATAQSLDTSGVTNIDYSDPSSLSLPAKLPQIQEQVSIDIYPEVPRPNEEVTITTEAYGTDLNTHLISWSVNGVEKLNGIGEKVFKFNVGNSGSVTKVKMVISPKNAPQIIREWSFSPIDVDILWQANTYTPPFYKGKALYTAESNITFLAIPNIIIDGVKLDNKEVVYKWKLDRKVQNEVSGYGKNLMSWTGPILLKEPFVQAEVYSSKNSSAKGINGTVVNRVDPKALFYENNARYGILFNKAIKGEFLMKSNEIKFSVFPYFFSSKNISDSVAYTWNLNDYKLNIPQDQNSAIFKRKDNNSGSSVVSIDIKNPNKVFQRTSSAFSVLYDSKKTDFATSTTE